MSQKVETAPLGPGSVGKIALSVCLITYNHAPYIEAAIESVLAQKLDVSWELIISDDCSTDGTRDIIRRYAALHPGRIRAILHEENLGSSAHLIQLLRAAQGEFIGYLEGDDKYLDERKLQIQVDYLRRHPECVGCFHDLIVVDAMGATVHSSYLASQGSRFEQKVGQEQLLGSGAIGQTNSWVFKRKCIENLPQWVLDFPLDKSLAFHLASFGTWGYIDRKMSLYRLHPGGEYSATSRQQQNELLLRQVLTVYAVPEYRARYRNTLQLSICQYSRELARAHRGKGSARYLAYLFKYLRYAPNKVTALKVVVVEEFLGRGTRTE